MVFQDIYINSYTFVLSVDFYMDHVDGGCIHSKETEEYLKKVFVRV